MIFPISIQTQEILKEVFETFYKSLVRYGTNFLLSEDESKDVVQDVFINLWNKKRSFENESALRSYLYTGVKNKCLNKIEHHKVKQRYQTQESVSESDGVLQEQYIYREEITRKIANAIQKLPLRQREVVQLTLQGMRNEEIAIRLKVKLQTVKNTKRKAYHNIREGFTNSI